MRIPALGILYEIFAKLERRLGFLCGKGYGTATIAQEVRMASFLLGRSPRLAVDIGGNIGDYSAELLRSNPELELHIFEPSTRNIKIMSERFAGGSRIKLEQSALSDSVGRMTLFADRDGSGLGSLTDRKLYHLDIRFEPMEQVEVRRFEDHYDTFLAGRIIDIVKIDVEGHELMVLHGFGESISKIRVIQFELGGANIDTKVFFRDFWRFFEKAGFSLYRITPLGVMRIDRYQESDEFFTIANFIAVNKNSLD